MRKIKCPTCAGVGRLSPDPRKPDFVTLARLILGMTQAQLGAALGFSEPLARHLESGRRNLTSPSGQRLVAYLLKRLEER